MTLYLQALLGIAVFIAIVLPMSSNRRSINWKLVGIALALQFVICILLLKAPVIKEGLLYLNQAVGALGAATLKGSAFVFGYVGGGDTPFTITNPNAAVTFAFQVLPLVIVMSALSALLWYWRILPIVIRGISWIFERALGTRGPSGLVATANIFLGQTEAPLLVRPYLARMSRYELLLVMTAGMATIAGSVMVIYSAMLGAQFEGVLGHLITKSIMSVPASVLFAHMILPDDNGSSQDLQESPRIYQSAMDSITRGTSDGLALFLNIIAILIVLTAFVALANSIVSFLPMVGGEALTLERIAGWIFAPIAWLMGIPWSEAMTAGSLLGVKSVLNEFIAFIQLTSVPPEALSDRSRLITIYGLCGFANLASIGIQISGIGTMAPERRDDLASLAWPAFVAATLGSCMTGCIVGIVAG
ncbi:MAG: nucleoside:proton symporter [Gammaproteobacteria bacterium]|jgi:CNT family concentrative nucleoside transporter|nr:nucleoside:proton symporter [Gammaproteobacteria bacterium]NDF86026.1 nucleoside:proton symporter [Gammaproteobacteria bacterium]